MDKLDSLESSLPPEQTPTPQAIDKLNQQVTQEFKIAANAVTSLYRLSSEKSSLNRHFGYSECLRDVLQLLQQDYTPEQMKQWCVEKQCELMGGEADLATKMPTDTMKSVPQSPSFHLSRPLMTVDHSSHFDGRKILKPEATEKFLQQRTSSTNTATKRKSKKIKTR